jgi:hypothetical protein
VIVNNAVEVSEEQFPASSASKKASCVSISADRHITMLVGFIYALAF